VNEISARVVCSQHAAERFNDVDWRQMMLHGEAHARVLSSSTATEAEADKSTASFVLAVDRLDIGRD